MALQAFGSQTGGYGNFGLQSAPGVKPPEYHLTGFDSYNDRANNINEYSMQTQRESALAPVNTALINSQTQLGMQQGRQDFVRQMFGDMFGSGGLQGFMSKYNGNGGSGPDINVGGIYTPRQVQQQVNSQVAGNDARYAGQLSDLLGSFGARGFSAKSPIASALRAQMAARNIGANADARRQTPFEYAQANATHLLNTQAARENQYGNRRKELIGMLSAFSPLFGNI